MATFKSTLTNNTVHINTSPDYGIMVSMTNAEADNIRSVVLDPSDRQAFALAILEAVDNGTYNGAQPGAWSALATGHTVDAIFSLRQAIQAADKDEAETEEQATLESEAESLYKVYRASCRVGFKVWADLDDQVRVSWTAVAKAARETNK